MFENHVKAQWARGAAVLGGWATLGSPFATEVLAVAGFDYVCVDLQHGLAHADAMVPMLIATARTGVTPLVRVPANDAASIGKALDAGAHGVVVPMVNSAQEARAAVAACRYAPTGTRSFGPVRAGLQTAGMSPEQVNDQVLCLPMVETTQALDRIDEICGTPGVDGIYIGPSDLSLTLGLPPYSDPIDDRLLDAVASIRAAAARHGLPVGIHTTSGRQARYYLDLGLNLVTVSTDAAILRAAVLAELAGARGGQHAGGSSGY